MSAPGTVVITWANGTDTFCLQKLGLLMDLEDKCKAAFAVIVGRLESGQWYIADVRETIRLGLMGGGMKPNDAASAVRNHVDLNENGYAPSALLAYEIARVALFGIPQDDPVGKGKPAEAKETGSPTTTDASDDPR